MSNRASRRQKVRSRTTSNGAARVRPFRPTGEWGVEVDSVDQGVVATFYIGDATVSISWAKTDARNIAKLILEAANAEGTPVENLTVERDSGLVVARTLPPT